MKTIIQMFNHLRAWFVSIGNISMFNRTYKTELIIVCNTIERLGSMARTPTEKKAITIVKRIIKNRASRAGVEAHLDKFLDKNVRK